MQCPACTHNTINLHWQHWPWKVRRPGRCGCAGIGTCAGPLVFCKAHIGDAAVAGLAQAFVLWVCRAQLDSMLWNIYLVLFMLLMTVSSRSYNTVQTNHKYCSIVMEIEDVKMGSCLMANSNASNVETGQTKCHELLTCHCEHAVVWCKTMSVVHSCKVCSKSSIFEDR